MSTVDGPEQSWSAELRDTRGAVADLERERDRLLAELEQARRTSEYLLRASRVLAEAGTFRETLEQLAMVAVPMLGDLCLIDVIDESNRLERVVARHASPALKTAADELWLKYPPDPEGSHPSMQVIRSGQSQWSAVMTDEFLRQTTRDERHFQLVTELGFKSYLTVPLMAGERVLGAVTLVSAGSGRRHGQEDLALAEELAHQVATVVARARLYDLEHEMAHSLQASLLPDRIPQMPGIRAAARYLPGTEGAEVGGDWYDLIPISAGQVGLVVGDVVGHDAAAATVMGQLRNALRAYALCEMEPAQVLAHLDDFTERLALDRMATVVFGVFQVATGAVTMSSAGHLPPLMVPFAGGDPHLIDIESGPLVGVSGAHYPQHHIDLAEGDMLVLYTDGLVEDRAQGLEPGMQRMLAAARAAPRDPELLCEALLVHTRGSARSDDVAVLAVQRRGGSGAGLRGPGATVQP